VRYNQKEPWLRSGLIEDVSVSDEAIETALAMAPRYQRHLHLPDKVLGWLYGWPYGRKSIAAWRFPAHEDLLGRATEAKGRRTEGQLPGTNKRLKERRIREIRASGQQFAAPAGL
jgi:hypothetical protein